MGLCERSKSIRIAIYATKPFYGRFHGFFNCGIYDVNKLSEADEIGQYLSDELIDSYSENDLYNYGLHDFIEKYSL